MSQFFSHIVLKGKNGDFAFSMHTLALDLSTLSVTTVVLKIAKINNTYFLRDHSRSRIKEESNNGRN